MKMKLIYLGKAISVGLALFLILFPPNTAAEKKFIPAISLLFLEDSPRVYDLDKVFDAINSSLGEDEGFKAVILALDKGYSLRQIVEAAMSDRLEVQGSIKSWTGEDEEPQFPPAGVIITESAAGEGQTVLSVYLNNDSVNLPVPLADLSVQGKKVGSDLDGNPLLILLKLAAMGYSPGQIVLSMMAERIAYFENISDYVGIFDEDGTFVLPELRNWFVEKLFHYYESFFLAKTVLPGHNGVSSCPGQLFIIGQKGDLITYCFEIRNFTSSNFKDIYFTDENLDDIGIIRIANPIPPGSTEMFCYPTEIKKDLVNIAKMGNTLVWQDDSLYIEAVPSNPVHVFEIEGADYPYVERSVRINWTNMGDSLGIAAVKDTIDNLISPLPRENGFMHIGSLGQASIPIPDEGTYILVVWINALTSRDGHFPKVVYFKLTLNLRPYKIETGKKIYEEPIIKAFVGRVNVDSEATCGNYTGPCIGWSPNFATLKFKRAVVQPLP